MNTWRMAFADSRFRRTAISAFILLPATLVGLRLVLDSIEERPGVVLADPLLALFAPVDLTWLTFTVIYGGLLFTCIRLFPRPAPLVTMLLSYCVMIFIRILCLLATPLEPPASTIPLADPIVEFFSSESIVLTKDLFFSGHTATLVLFALGMPDRTSRFILAGFAATVAAAVLLQHVHYTIDVVVAPLAAVTAFIITTPLRSFLLRTRT